MALLNRVTVTHMTNGWATSANNVALRPPVLRSLRAVHQVGLSYLSMYPRVIGQLNGDWDLKTSASDPRKSRNGLVVNINAVRFCVRRSCRASSTITQSAARQ